MKQQFIEEELLPTIRRAVGRYAGGVLRHYDRADVEQDVLLRLLRDSAAKGRPPTQLFAWVGRVARHRIIDLVRHMRPVRGESQVPAERWSVGRGTTTGEVTSKDLHEVALRRVSGWIQELKNEEQREVAALIIDEGLCDAEVATLLGKSQGAVYKLRTRALEHLRRRARDTPL
ncbi:MAG: sigma-70 family RNA polymerase sigma factor [Planctomycetota bacterium]